ncbi:putative diguanylate cyclase [compost metagenome]
MQLMGQSVQLGASVGVAHHGHGPSETLYQQADIALYAAKAAGRGTSRIFDSHAANHT